MPKKKNKKRDIKKRKKRLLKNQESINKRKTIWEILNPE